MAPPVNDVHCLLWNPTVAPLMSTLILLRLRLSLSSLASHGGIKRFWWILVNWFVGSWVETAPEEAQWLVDTSHVARPEGFWWKFMVYPWFQFWILGLGITLLVIRRRGTAMQLQGLRWEAPLEGSPRFPPKLSTLHCHIKHTWNTESTNRDGSSTFRPQLLMNEWLGGSRRVISWLRLV